MTREKKTVEYKIKTHAKNGDVDMVDALANEFLIYKVNIKKLTKLKGQMSNIKQKIQMMRSVKDINTAILSLTHTMKSMNSKMGIANIASMVMEYDMETNRMQTSMEMFDDVMEDDIDEDEREEIVNSVLAEIGVELASTMKDAPGVDNEVEKLLESRLANLLA